LLTSDLRQRSGRANLRRKLPGSPLQYIVNEITLIVRFRQLQDYSCGGDSLGVRHTRPDTTTPVISIYIHNLEIHRTAPAAETPKVRIDSLTRTTPVIYILNTHTIYSVSQSHYILSVSVSETGCQSSVTALVIGRWTRNRPRPSPARARTFHLQHMTAAHTMKSLSQAT